MFVQLQLRAGILQLPVSSARKVCEKFHVVRSRWMFLGDPLAVISTRMMAMSDDMIEDHRNEYDGHKHNRQKDNDANFQHSPFAPG